MIGEVDGANRSFTTPSAFKAGSLRLFWNGQEVEAWDDRKGWVEVSDWIIETKVAPKVGDVLSCFYQEVSLVPGIWNVRGSPIDPSGIFP
jgi:hypothetical protein